MNSCLKIISQFVDLLKKVILFRSISFIAACNHRRTTESVMEVETWNVGWYDREGSYQELRMQETCRSSCKGKIYHIH